MALLSSLQSAADAASAIVFGLFMPSGTSGSDAAASESLAVLLRSMAAFWWLL